MGFTRIWRQFCILVVRVFYRHYEVVGLEQLKTDNPVLLCANHANALADAVVLQAISSRLIHPLARSGLFKNPVLWPVLKLIQAVPVYRRQDNGVDTAKNLDSFERCYDLFDEKGILLIFPEVRATPIQVSALLKRGPPGWCWEPMRPVDRSRWCYPSA